MSGPWWERVFLAFFWALCLWLILYCLVNLVIIIVEAVL